MAALKPIISFFFCLALLLCCAKAQLGPKVGGRTEVKNVTTNKEVQALGRYSVQEYNTMQQKKGQNGSLLTFSEVVEAQTQVVSGIKYYLKISAIDGRAPKTYDAVLVVQEWRHSKELLSFAPSSAH